MCATHYKLALPDERKTTDMPESKGPEVDKPASDAELVKTKPADVVYGDWCMCGRLLTIAHIKVRPKRSPESAWLTQINPTIGLATVSNNDLQYEFTGQSSKYTSMYATGGDPDEGKSVARAIATVEATRVRKENARKAATAGGIPGSVPPPGMSLYSQGLSMLMASWRAKTASTAVSSTMASYLLLGNRRYIFTYDFIICSMYQCLDLLLGKSVSTIMSSKGWKMVPYEVDYLYRPLELEELCRRQFGELYKRVRKKKEKKW